MGNEQDWRLGDVLFIRKGKNKRHSERMKRWEAAKSVEQSDNYFWVRKKWPKRRTEK